jgi:hypothetical protein
VNSGTSRDPASYLFEEDVMKAYFSNVPMKIWLMLVVPGILLAYPIVRIVVAATISAVVPGVVRTVLHLM